jgi:hypothetical protein
MATDLDVLDRLVIHERLQTAQSEQRVEHRAGQIVLLGRSEQPGRGATTHLSVHVLVQQPSDDISPDLPLPLGRHCAIAELVGKQLGGLLPQRPDQAPVQRATGVAGWQWWWTI